MRHQKIRLYQQSELIQAAINLYGLMNLTAMLLIQQTGILKLAAMAGGIMSRNIISPQMQRRVMAILSSRERKKMYNQIITHHRE